MASPRSFFKILCLFICVGMAWFSVVAKPIELPTLSQHRYITNSSHIVDAVGGMRNGNNRSVDGHPPATLVIDTPACIDNHHCTSGCKVTSAAPNIHTFTCSPSSHCSLLDESVGATYSCYTHGGETVKLNAVPSILVDPNVAPFLPMWHHDYSPAPYSAAPVDAEEPAITGADDPTNLPSPLAPGPSHEVTVTHTARVTHGRNGEPDGPVMTPAPADDLAPVPGYQTVFVTITEDSTTAAPVETEPFSSKPLSPSPHESNKTAIILGSVFGSLTILCISIVSVDHLLKLRRQKREALQECQDGQECQESHDSVSSTEDMSELLRQQQQTYGYYGTQRVASSCLVPQQMKVFPTTSQPVELPTPKDGMVEKERRDGH